MVSDMLSQDEIDALLKQGGSDEEDSTSTSVSIDDYITAIEQDALGEIGNITFGSASTALSTLLGQKVDITTPELSILLKERVHEEFPNPHVAIHVNYTEGFQGINLLVIRTEDARIIADIMMGGDGKSPSEELSEISISAVQEAMNQMMGSAATSMSTIFSKKVDISPPGIDILDVVQDPSKNILLEDEVFIKVSFRMKVGDLIDSNIMQLITVPFAKQLVELLINPAPPSSETKPKPKTVESVPEKQAPPSYQEQQVNQQGQQPIYQQPVQQPMYQQPIYEQPIQQQMVQQQQMPSFNQQIPSQFEANRNANVQPVQFSSFDQGSSGTSDIKNLNLLLDIPLQVTVELGRTKRVIKDILELSPGSILELDKLAGEPVDILVNNKLIAKGEVVVIEENFGVRVTDILSQWDRLQKLQ
jgi:flagellar motor switch protein FliN/FliY